MIDSDKSGRAIGNNNNQDNDNGGRVIVNDTDGVIELVSTPSKIGDNYPTYDTSPSGRLLPSKHYSRESSYAQVNATDSTPLFPTIGIDAWNLVIRGSLTVPTVTVEGSSLRVQFDSDITGTVAKSMDSSGQHHLRITVEPKDEFPIATNMLELRNMINLPCAPVSYDIFTFIREQFFTRTILMHGQKVLEISPTSDTEYIPKMVVYFEPQLSRKERNRIMHAINGNIEYLMNGDNVTTYNIYVGTNSTNDIHVITQDGLYFMTVDIVNNSNGSQRCIVSTVGSTAQNLGTDMVSYYTDKFRVPPFKALAGTTIRMVFQSASTAQLNGVVKIAAINHIDEAVEYKARMHNRAMHMLNGNTTLEDLESSTAVELDLAMLTGEVPIVLSEPKMSKPAPFKVQLAETVNGVEVLRDVSVEELLERAVNHSPTNSELEELENLLSSGSDDCPKGSVYSDSSDDDPSKFFHGMRRHDETDYECAACEEENDIEKTATIVGIATVPNDIYMLSTNDVMVRSFLAPNYYRWLEVDLYIAKDSALTKHENLESMPKAVPLGRSDEENFSTGQPSKPRGTFVKALNNKQNNWAHVVRRWKGFSSEKFQTKFTAAIKYNLMYTKLGKHDNFYKAVLECNDDINSDVHLKDRLTRLSKSRSLQEMSEILGLCDDPNEQVFKLHDSYFSSHVKECKAKIISQYKTIAGYWQDMVSEDLTEFNVCYPRPLQYSDLPMKGACEGWDLYLKNSANKRAHSLFGNIDVDATEYNPEAVPTFRSVIDKVRMFNVGVSSKAVEVFISKCYPSLRQMAYFASLQPTSQVRSSDTNTVPFWRNGNGQQMVTTYWNLNAAGGGVNGSSSPKLYCLLTRRYPNTSTSLLIGNINESWTPLLTAAGGPVRNYAILNPVLGLPLSLGLVYTSVVAQPLPCSLECWFYRSIYYLQQALFREGFLSGQWVYPSQSALGYPVENGVNATWTGIMQAKNINGGNSAGPADPYFGAAKSVKFYTFDPTQIGVTNFWVFPSQIYEKFGFPGLIMFISMIHDFPLLSMGINGCAATESHAQNLTSGLPNDLTLLSALGIQSRHAPVINILLPTEVATIPATAAAAIAASRVAVPNAYVGALYSTATQANYDGTTMMNEQLVLLTADTWSAWIDYLCNTYGAGSDLQAALYMFAQMACRPILDQSRHEDHSNVPWVDPQWDGNVTVTGHKFNNGRIITGSRHHLHNSGNIESSATAFKPTYILDVPMMAWNALALKMATRSVKRDGELNSFPRSAPDMYAYLDYCSMTQRVAYWNFYKIIGTSALTWAVNNYDLEASLYDPVPKMTNYQKLLLKVHQALYDWVPPQSIDNTNCLYRYHLDTYHTNEHNLVTAYIPGSGLTSAWAVQLFDCGVKMSIRYVELISTLEKFYLLHCLPQRQYALPKMKWVINRPDYPAQQDVTGILQGNFANSIPVTLKSFNSSSFPQVNNEYFQELMTYNSMIQARVTAIGTWGDARNIQAAANNQIYLPAPFQWVLAGWQAQVANFSTGVDYGQYSLKEIINMAFYTDYNGFLTMMIPRSNQPLYLTIKEGLLDQKQFWYIFGNSVDSLGYVLAPQEDQLAGLLEMDDVDLSKGKSSEQKSDMKPPSIQAKSDEAALNPGDESLKA